MKINAIDELGRIKEYEAILTYHSEEYNKHYVVYTDNTRDEKDNLNIYAAIYYPNDDSRLESIETDEEWDEIERRLNDL